jgi:cyclin B
LVGVSALFIASKYEEIYPPELKDFVYVTDKAYTKKEILKMERTILTELSFDITYPTALRFLEIFIEISNCLFDEDAYFFARYLLELFLVEYKSINYLPSLIAASCLFLTFKICRSLNTNFNPVDLNIVTGYSEEKIRNCAKDILVVLDGVHVNQLQAVKNKYSLGKFMEVAKVKN